MGKIKFLTTKAFVCSSPEEPPASEKNKTPPQSANRSSIIKQSPLKAHKKQKIYKLTTSGYYFPFTSLLVFIFCFLHPAIAAPPTCPPWLNIYDGNKQEKITPRVLPGLDANGKVQYETCTQATKRREKEVQRRHANRNAHRNIKGGSRENCIFTEPLPPFKEHKLEVRQIGENPDGTPRYETCRNAQWRKQEEWRKSEGWEHKEDLEDEIARYNSEEDKKALSASKEAEEAAKKQQKTSLITTAGSMAAGAAAAVCCSKTPVCGACPYLVALSAGLGIAGLGLMLASDDNTAISAQYAGNLLNNPNAITSNNLGLPSSTGAIISSAPSSTPTPPSIPTPPGVSLPKITLPNGDTVVPTPENLGPYLKKHKLKWDPKNKRITLPNGQSYTADDLDNPEFKQYANSTPVANLKKQMKNLEKQIVGNKENTKDSLANEASTEEDGTPEGAGGGGFAGYNSGSSGSRWEKGGGEGGSLMAGLTRTPDSTNSDSSQVAGMSVKMGKNQVGVRQDNIFEMIHRRYQTKRKKQQFIEIKF